MMELFTGENVTLFNEVKALILHTDKSTVFENCDSVVLAGVAQGHAYGYLVEWIDDEKVATYFKAPISGNKFVTSDDTYEYKHRLSDFIFPLSDENNEVYDSYQARTPEERKHYRTLYKQLLCK
ncbi:TPA: hypothetical protein ACTZ5V_003558 [Bacillus cereus]